MRSSQWRRPAEGGVGELWVDFDLPSSGFFFAELGVLDTVRDCASPRAVSSILVEMMIEHIRTGFWEVDKQNQEK